MPSSNPFLSFDSASNRTGVDRSLVGDPVQSPSANANSWTWPDGSSTISPLANNDDANYADLTSQSNSPNATFLLMTDDGAGSNNFVPAAGAQTAGGGTSFVAVSAATSSASSTLVGAAGGLQIDLVWDASVNSAPAGFKQAAITAATEYTTMFSNPETITIDVGYGEVGGAAIYAGNLSQSRFFGLYEKYSAVRAALTGDASSSPDQAEADSTLPTTDPTNGGKFFVTKAEAGALGLASSAGLDGAIGLSSAVSFDYNAPATPVAAGQYDAIGAFEHEISEVMGRFGSVGKELGANVYTPLDLFRYTSSGVPDLTVGPASPYFSINDGATNLDAYNNPATGGDASDWARTIAGDSYGFGYSGRTASVSSTDLIEDSVLGYRLTAAGLAATQTPGLA